MLSLPSRIRTGDHWSRLNQAKLPLAKVSPTLAGPQRQTVCLLNVRSERLSVPQVTTQAEIRWPPAQGGLYFGDLLRIQPARAPTALPFPQAGQTVPLEAVHPIFHRSGGITQQIRHLAAAHSLGDEQYTMQTVIIPGFRASSDLVLQSKDDRRCIRNRQRFHESMIAQFSDIRNYLCPRV